VSRRLAEESVFNAQAVVALASSVELATQRYLNVSRAMIFLVRAPLFMAGSSFTPFGSEMHSQTDDQAEIIRLGFNAVRANLGIGDAIPDSRNIEREAFVEVN
jgi:hypothetical protein